MHSNTIQPQTLSRPIELVLGQLPKPREQRESAPLTALELSLVVPVFNEEQSLQALYDVILKVFGARDQWELLLIDDGSEDRCPELIAQLAAQDSRVRGVYFEHNCGQTAAMGAGIQLARGDLIATLDADLQNDPADIPILIAQLGEHDAIVGYRTHRNDSWSRRASSNIANRLRNWISRDSIIDTGCSLKVFRAGAIQAIPLFEGMHRFFPTLLRYHGFSVREAPVAHHARHAGRSKYGVMNRAWRGFVDLLAVRWMRSRTIRVPVVTPLPMDSKQR